MRAQRRGRKSAVGQKTDARARFPRYAVDDVSRRRRVLQLLRALDRGLPSAALFRICGAAKRRCRPALAIGLGSGSALCVPAQSMLLYAGGRRARTALRGPGLSRISHSSSCNSRSTIYHATHDPTVLSFFSRWRWSMRASISSARFSRSAVPAWCGSGTAAALRIILPVTCNRHNRASLHF